MKTITNNNYHIFFLVFLCAINIFSADIYQYKNGITIVKSQNDDTPYAYKEIKRDQFQDEQSLSQTLANLLDEKKNSVRLYLDNQDYSLNIALKGVDTKNNQVLIEAPSTPMIRGERRRSTTVFAFQTNWINLTQLYSLLHGEIQFTELFDNKIERLLKSSQYDLLIAHLELLKDNDFSYFSYQPVDSHLNPSGRQYDGSTKSGWYGQAISNWNLSEQNANYYHIEVSPLAYLIINYESIDYVKLFTLMEMFLEKGHDANMGSQIKHTYKSGLYNRQTHNEAEYLSPLHYAAIVGRDDIVQFLLTFEGINIKPVALSGVGTHGFEDVIYSRLTPFEIALMYDNFDIANIFLNNENGEKLDDMLLLKLIKYNSCSITTNLLHSEEMNRQFVNLIADELIKTWSSIANSNIIEPILNYFMDDERKHLRRYVTESNLLLRALSNQQWDLALRLIDFGMPKYPYLFDIYSETALHKVCKHWKINQIIGDELSYYENSLPKILDIIAKLVQKVPEDLEVKDHHEYKKNERDAFGKFIGRTTMIIENTPYEVFTEEAKSFNDYFNQKTKDMTTNERQQFRKLMDDFFDNAKILLSSSQPSGELMNEELVLSTIEEIYNKLCNKQTAHAASSKISSLAREVRDGSEQSFISMFNSLTSYDYEIDFIKNLRNFLVNNPDVRRNITQDYDFIAAQNMTFFDW